MKLSGYEYKLIIDKPRFLYPIVIFSSLICLYKKIKFSYKKNFFSSFSPNLYIAQVSAKYKSDLGFVLVILFSSNYWLEIPPTQYGILTLEKIELNNRIIMIEYQLLHGIILSYLPFYETQIINLFLI